MVLQCVSEKIRSVKVARDAVCCNALQGTVVCCSVLQCFAVYYSVLHCVAAVCSVLQCAQGKYICVIPTEIRERVAKWRRPMRCLKLQVGFRQRATNYRALLRKIT